VSFIRSLDVSSGKLSQSSSRSITEFTEFTEGFQVFGLRVVCSQAQSDLIAGAVLGAAYFAAVGLKALALPVALSLPALAMGLGVKHGVTN